MGKNPYIIIPFPNRRIIYHLAQNALRRFLEPCCCLELILTTRQSELHAIRWRRNWTMSRFRHVFFRFRFLIMCARCRGHLLNNLKLGTYSSLWQICSNKGVFWGTLFRCRIYSWWLGWDTEEILSCSRRHCSYMNIPVTLILPWNQTFIIKDCFKLL